MPPEENKRELENCSEDIPKQYLDRAEGDRALARDLMRRDIVRPRED